MSKIQFKKEETEHRNTEHRAIRRESGVCYLKGNFIKSNNKIQNTSPHMK